MKKKKKKKEPDIDSFEHIEWLNSLTPKEWAKHCLDLKSKMDNNGWTHTDIKKPFVGDRVFVYRPKRCEAVAFQSIKWCEGDELEYPFWMECKKPKVK